MSPEGFIASGRLIAWDGYGQSPILETLKLLLWLNRVRAAEKALNEM